LISPESPAIIATGNIAILENFARSLGLDLP
jgi:hypothetical protein